MSGAAFSETAEIHDECGVFGLWSPERTALAHLVYSGLFALQHRGQESAGIVINDDGAFLAADRDWSAKSFRESISPPSGRERSPSGMYATRRPARTAAGTYSRS